MKENEDEMKMNWVWYDYEVKLGLQWDGMRLQTHGFGAALNYGHESKRLKFIFIILK